MFDGPAGPPMLGTTLGLGGRADEAELGGSSGTAAFRGPVVLTVAYVVVYYSFMGLRSRALDAARHRVSLRNGTLRLEDDEGAHMGERVFVDTGEQLAVYVVSLWSCAAFVSCELATVLSGAALAARCCMPIVWASGPDGKRSLRVELLSVQPYYLCVFGQLGATLTWALTGTVVTEVLSTPLLVGFILGAYVALLTTTTLLGKAAHMHTRRAYDAPNQSIAITRDLFGSSNGSLRSSRFTFDGSRNGSLV